MKLKKNLKKEKPQRKQITSNGRLNIRKILVPIDFSEHSKNALQYAVAFASEHEAELLLVFVVEPTIYPADFSFGQVAVPSIEKELRERGDLELDQLVEKTVAGKVKAGKMVLTGKPFLEIINAAAEEEIDLIIIATHGHTGVEHILFGGTAEKVVRKAPCPVLVVRPVE